MIVLHNSPENALESEAALVTEFRKPATNHVLAFWTTDQCLVVPASLKKQTGYTMACAQLIEYGWPVVQRKTGGGITPQGPGILNVSLAYALDPVEQPSIKGVYQMLCGPLIKLLTQFGCQAHTGFVPNSFCDGEYNIVVEGRKIMGTAQRWTRVKSLQSRQIVFAHALILLDADLHAGVEAINRLYRALSIEKPIEVDAHSNLLALARGQGKSVTQSDVVRILSGMYTEELIALSE